VVALRTNGFDEFNNDNINKRSIRKDIKEHHIKTGCICCGTMNDLVIDHKNDLYNDPLMEGLLILNQYCYFLLFVNMLYRLYS
jgi:G3E family GTPase